MEINKYHWFMLVSLGATFLVYTLCLFLMSNVFDTSQMDIKTFGYTFLIAVVAWAPFFIINKLKKCIFPQVSEKLSKSEE
jgi:hypothetical protein